MLNRIKTVLGDFITNPESELSSADLRDREPQDSGSCCEKLKQSVSAFPRKLKQIQLHSFKRSLQNIDVYNLYNKQEDEIQNAITVLKAFTDKQLSELGVPRQNIEFVVRNGRPRLEEDPRNLSMKLRQAVAA
jgi:hypothetical protein